MSTTEVVKPSRFKIVNDVVALLKLGEFGKLESFIKKTVSVLEREVTGLKRSIKNEQGNLSVLIEDIQEQIEDAQQGVEEAYTNLDPEKLKTNEAQKEFREKYLDSIDNAEGNVQVLVETLEAHTKLSQEVVENLEAEIAVREMRIKRFKEGVVGK